MTDRTVAQILAELACRTEWDAMPAEVREEARKLVVNSIGVAIGGADLPDAVIARETAADSGQEARVMMGGTRASLVEAMFANATLFSCLGQEETHVATSLHPAEVVLPALLTYAEKHPTSGRELLAALAIGCEVAIQANSPEFLPIVRAEFAETAVIYGAIGTAAALSRIRGSSEAETTAALAIAAGCAGGTSECFGAGTSEFHFALGMGAQLGHRAAALAARGGTAAPLAFEGRAGLYRLAGALDPAVLEGADVAGEVDRRINSSWRILELVYKPWPVHIFNIPFIESAIALRGELATAGVGEIESVAIELTGSATSYGGAYKGPYTGRDEVVGSTGFLVCAALVNGTVGLRETLRFDDPDVLGLLARTEVSGADPDVPVGRLTMRAGGAAFERVVRVDPERYRMDRPAIAEIYRQAVRGVIDNDRADQLERVLMSFEEVEDVAREVLPFLSEPSSTG